MAAALPCLAEGGRMGLITWKHSECAILLDFFRENETCRPEYPMLKWWETRKVRSDNRKSHRAHGAFLLRSLSLFVRSGRLRRG